MRNSLHGEGGKTLLLYPWKGMIVFDSAYLSEIYWQHIHKTQKSWESNSSMNAKALKPHQKNDATWVFGTSEGFSAPCQEMLVNLFSLGEWVKTCSQPAPSSSPGSRRRWDWHSLWQWWLSELLWETQCSAEGVSTSLPGARLGPPSPTITVGGLSYTAF